MRSRLTAVTALAIVLAMMAASPATAATALTRARMVSSLLTGNELGDGWHKFTDSSSDESTVTGCAATSYKSVGVRREAGRDFQYEQFPLFINQGIQAFRTDKLARADFTKSVGLFADCPTFTVDGKVWTIVRLAVPKYAEQQVMFRISGMVATETGDVKLTRFLVASRHSLYQVTVLVTAAGNDITPQISRDLKRSAVRVSRLATANVVDALGR